MQQLTRPGVFGGRYAISTTHYLATEAGMRMFRKGGNAIDAGVAAGIALGVVERDLVDFAGVAPIMVRVAGMEEPVTIDGLGRWPLDLTLDGYLERYGGEMPIGISRSVTPGAPAAWLTALAEFGSLSLADVLEPAIELADGFAVYPRLAASIAAEATQLAGWPSSAGVFLPDGRVPAVGELFRQPDLRALLITLAEAANNGSDRRAGIHQAKDAFYRGEVADRIAAFMAAAGGHLTAADLALTRSEIARPVRSDYRDTAVFACGPWSQGPVVPMALNMLEFENVAGLEPDDPQIPPSVCGGTEARLCRPRRVLRRPGSGRRADGGTAGPPVRPRPTRDDRGPGCVRSCHRQGIPVPCGGRAENARRIPDRRGAPGRDTAFVTAIDMQGNAFAATPSDSGLSGPVVPGLGIVVSTRGSQFHLEPGHPSCIAPGKRPRLTPNPAMLIRNGEVALAFGCPGGDAQPQAMVQVATRVVDFGMPVQQAIDQARVVTLSAPDSFHPHGSQPGVLLVEDLVGPSAIADLRARGHLVRTLDGYSRLAGAVCATRLNGGVLEAGADPRRDCAAVAW